MRLKPILIPSAFILVSAASAQVALTSNAPTYSQSFDTLAATGTANAWTNNVTLPGWYAFNSGTTSANTVRDATTTAVTAYLAGTGSNNQGGLYSFGSATTPNDRALGSLESNSYGDLGYGIAFLNNTGRTINSFTLSFTGEEWRNGGNTDVQSLVFDYGVASTFSPALFDVSNTTGFNTPASGTFNSPVHTATAGLLDGNAAANRVTGLGVAGQSVSIAPGAYLVLRWWNNNDAGNDHGLAIDDLSFSATTFAQPTPEPGAFAALGVGIIAVLRRRRKA